MFVAEIFCAVYDNTGKFAMNNLFRSLFVIVASKDSSFSSFSLLFY